MPVQSNPIKRYALISGSAWTLIVISSFAWSYFQQKNNTLEIATSEARIAFQKDTLYRKWGAKHGGVYVPVSQETPPNPNLSNIPERDISTPSGKSLTLVNPAYMTRQVFELASAEAGFVRGHITSLTPIRKENAPDPWERGALQAFERGVKEVTEVQVIDGQKYLRFMRPFITAQECLKCHAEQGYKIGDVRGGISVSVPLSVLSASSNKIIAGTGATHGLIWLLGIGMIGLGSRKLSRSAADLHEKNLLLVKEISERQMAQERLQEQASLLEDEIGERQMAQEALQEQAVMLEEEIAERAQAEAAIRQSEEKFAKSFQNAPLMMAITTIEDGTFLDINNKFMELSGYRREEIIGKSSLELGWINATDRERIRQEGQRHGHVSGMDLSVCTRDGRPLTTVYYGEYIPMDGETRLLSVCLDVTEHRKVEAQLLHAQKMDAVGTLAGGMAHDFNNILTVIAGYATLLSMRFKSGSEEYAMAGEIAASVDRASEMTRSLLAFSRKEPMNMKPDDINRIIAALEKSLRRLIREDIDLRCALSDHPIPIMVDKGQLEQVIVNLVVNARDAMPSGGTLSITSSIVEVQDGNIGPVQGIPPGRYGLISVSDTGFGMDKETREHIFEPFFTTKEANQGTGLGLSIVHGIVTKHQGRINVYSERGHGTTFRIYLPLVDQPHQSEHVELHEETLPGGDETILLVDDDAAVRQMTTFKLKSFGYKVLVADNGAAALSIFRENRETIQLLITDVIMPKMNGKELYQEIGRLKSNIPAIFMSGYTADIMEEQKLPHDDVIFLSKPLKPGTLLVSIRQILDSRNISGKEQGCV